jgi:hypothetical protein
MNGPSAAATAPKEAPRVKGPIVWLDRDQRELDDAYDQLGYAPNRDQCCKILPSAEVGLGRSRMS